FIRPLFPHLVTFFLSFFFHPRPLHSFPTRRSSDLSYALFRLALAAAPVLQYLNLATDINSPDRSTKSTRSHFNVLSVLVGTRFQVLFHSPPGVLFTFPSRYCSTIGH